MFLDRDGTLNEERGYLRDVQQLVLLPGAAQALRRAQAAGWRCILTTNQSGPARGFYDESHIHALHQRLAALLQAEAGVVLDAVYYCAHHPRGVVPAWTQDCQCRKPRPGMILQAVKDFPDIDLAASVVLGDKASDVAFAHAAGCQSVLLRTGYGQRVLDGKYQRLAHPPTWVCDSIVEAVDALLAQPEAALKPPS
jgi:D-glycero-D-manno-heptose 1,7-bisphosphate phosphatase